MKKKKDSKKIKKQKQKQKSVKQKPNAELEELKAMVKKLAKSLSQLESTHASLKADFKKLKKEKKKEASEVIKNVVEKISPTPKPTSVRQPRKTATRTVSAPRAKPDPKPKVTPRTRTSTAKPAAPKRPGNPNDLRFIQGLGAKIESLLTETGIKSFADLARSSQAKIKSVLEQAGPRFKNQDPKSLIEQAKLVKDEKWAELKAFQEKLLAGKGKPGPKTGDTQQKTS